MNKWTFLEEWNLFLGCMIIPNQWAKIAEFFPNRADNHLKNHWRTNSMKEKVEHFGEKLSEIVINSNLLDIVMHVENNYKQSAD